MKYQKLMVKLSILGLIFLLYKRGKKSGAREEIKVPQLSIKKQKTSHSYILVNKEEQSKKSKQWFLCKETKFMLGKLNL